MWQSHLTWPDLTWRTHRSSYRGGAHLKIRIEKLWFSFKNWFICFFPHELTCMWSYHLLLKFPPIKHTVFFTKRQCVTSSETWITCQTKQRGLGGGPVCFFERDAIFLECSKANFDKFWKDFNIKFWCHTLTHGTVLRRLPLELLHFCTVTKFHYLIVLLHCCTVTML